MGDFTDLSFITNQPAWVLLLLAAAAAVVIWRFDLFGKLKLNKPGPSKKKSTIPVAESLLPPGVVEMKKSNAEMRRILDEAIAAETKKTVDEYTRLMTLTAGGSVNLG